MSDQPYFDDTRKALTFALNFEGDVKAPMMSRLLAQVQAAPRKVSKAARKRFLAQFDATLNPEAYKFAERFIDGQFFGRKRKTSWAPPSPRGLDGAHLAGWIMAQFARIDTHHQVLLKGRAIRAYSRCACGSPCCSGWRKDPAWAQAVRETCLHLEAVGDVMREPGKRGLSTQPAMRLAIVEQFYTDNSLSVTDLARIGQVALATAAKHKEWIIAYLKQEEDNAWQQLDLIFDSAGITGAFD